VAPLSFHAVIELSFTPLVTVGGLAVRLETLAAAGAIVLALLVAALIARWTPVDLSLPPDAPSPDPEDDGPNRLRADDLLYITIAAFPGAVLGGRLGYGLLHLDYYSANPGALTDVAQGGLQLSLGVVGGLVTASIVAGLLGAPLGRWLHALTLPLLLLLAGAKGAMILGGSGQGLPWSGDLATAYLGDGPWGSLAPAVPAYPAQALEAVAILATLAFTWWLMALGLFARRSGAVFFVGVGLWAVARALVATVWRDPLVAGPLRMDQVISVVIAAACAVVVLVLSARAIAAAVQGRTAST
jgi:prolipoprotein diacylglyceryltransferase